MKPWIGFEDFYTHFDLFQFQMIYVCLVKTMEDKL